MYFLKQGSSEAANEAVFSEYRLTGNTSALCGRQVRLAMRTRKKVRVGNLLLLRVKGAVDSSARTTLASQSCTDLESGYIEFVEKAKIIAWGAAMKPWSLTGARSPYTYY